MLTVPLWPDYCQCTRASDWAGLVAMLCQAGGSAQSSPATRGHTGPTRACHFLTGKASCTNLCRKFLIVIVIYYFNCIEARSRNDQYNDDATLACGAATARIVGGVDTLKNQIPWQCTFYNSDDSWFVHLFDLIE